MHYPCEMIVNVCAVGDLQWSVKVILCLYLISCGLYMWLIRTKSTDINDAWYLLLIILFVNP